MEALSPHMKRVKIGAMIAVAGTVPLLIYVRVGPKDGNPIGLGLLMWLCWLVGGALVAAGFIGGAIARIRRNRS